MQPPCSDIVWNTPVRDDVGKVLPYFIIKILLVPLME